MHRLAIQTPLYFFSIDEFDWVSKPVSPIIAAPRDGTKRVRLRKPSQPLGSFAQSVPELFSSLTGAAQDGHVEETRRLFNERSITT